MEQFFYTIEQDLQTGLIILFACCSFTVMAALFDMWTALEAVKATGAKPESHPLAKTGYKIIDHLRMILYVVMIDILGLICLEFYNIPYLAVLMTVGILFREGLSMRENYILKKSSAVETIDMVQKIVECLTREDAEKLIKSIHERHSKKYTNDSNS